MDMKKVFILSVAASAVSISAMAHEFKAPEGKEKCYGVAKAGKNDCGSKLGKHGCAGMSKKDASTVDFILVPQGLCAKLVNGSPEEKLEIAN